MVFLKKYFGLIAVIVLSIFSILPFFNSGFFPMHDDTQVARVFEMGKALKDGIFPVRWVPDLGYGYGYPIFNYYAPLSYYIGGFINILGFDALISTKIMMVLGIVLAGVFMYFLAREFFGEIGGIIAGLFYVYAPYHAVNIYVRGAVGEFYAYAFIPLMFLGFYKVFASINGKSKIKYQISKIWKWVVVGSSGYAGVILSHNLTAMMVTPFLLFWILICLFLGLKKRQFSIFNFQFSILILGILLSAFYWLPALTEMKYTNVMSQIGGGADFKDHFVCIQQLWNSQWGFGGSTKGCIDGMSFKLGKLHILLSLISFLFISLFFIKSKLYVHLGNKVLAVGLSILALIISAFFTLEISEPVWEAIPSMAFFQYPWRFLILTSFFSSFLAGSAVWFVKGIIKIFVQGHSRLDRESINKLWIPAFAKSDLAFAGMTILILLLFNTKLFNPQTITSKTAADYTSDYAIKWVASKISDEYLPKDFVKPESYSEIKKNKSEFNTKPKETFIQQLANFLSLTGIVVLILGIIYTLICYSRAPLRAGKSPWGRGGDPINIKS